MLPGMASPMLAGGVVYDATTEAYFAQMTQRPPATWGAAANALLVGMKDDGVWPFVDVLVLGAAHHEQAGRLNARYPSAAKLAAPTGTMAFTPYRGWQATSGVAGSNYLDTSAFNADGSNWTLNAAALGGYSNRDYLGGSDTPYLWLTQDNDNYSTIALFPDGQGGGSPFFGGVNAGSGERMYAASGSSPGLHANIAVIRQGGSQLFGEGTQYLGNGNGGYVNKRPNRLSAGRERAAVAWYGNLTQARYHLLRARITTFVNAIGAQ